MHKTTTHFEQVPLETVRRIMEQIQKEATNADRINNETLEAGFAKVEEPSAAVFASFLMGSYETSHASRQEKNQERIQEEGRI
ncbi:MAG TPA: hypothetical protein VKQ28_04245 [Candidatus Acidoferrum sp.]|nr:hypothetical protein [Candidatus Acidoferrum sp.]